MQKRASGGAGSLQDGQRRSSGAATGHAEAGLFRVLGPARRAGESTHVTQDTSRRRPFYVKTVTVRRRRAGAVPGRPAAARRPACSAARRARARHPRKAGTRTRVSGGRSPRASRPGALRAVTRTPRARCSGPRPAARGGARRRPAAARWFARRGPSRCSWHSRSSDQAVTWSGSIAKRSTSTMSPVSNVSATWCTETPYSARPSRIATFKPPSPRRSGSGAGWKLRQAVRGSSISGGAMSLGKRNETTRSTSPSEPS